jgi:mRNA interferase MazF
MTVNHVAHFRRFGLLPVNFNLQKKKEEVGKVRPAIIMSDTQLNEVLDLVSVIALTINLIEDSEPLRISKRNTLKKVI